MAKVDDKKYAEFMAKRKKEKKQTSTEKSLAAIRDRGEKAAARKEGYVSAAQRAAVWATRADGGKGHPDNKRKKKKTEDVNEISKGMASRYIKKSQVSTADAAKNVERGNIDSKSPDKDISKKGKDQAKKGIKHFINRNKGTSTAVDKLTGKAKVPATEDVNEGKDHVSSNHAMHYHETEAEKKSHADYMKKKHGVKTTYHGEDELRYHGPKKNVRKALGNHYHDDHEHAKEEHPHIYKEAYSEPQGQAKRMMSPLQKMRQDKEKADRDSKGRLKAGIGAMKKAGNEKAKAELGEKILTQKDKERAFAKAAKTAQPKSQVSLKKAPFKIPSEKDMKNEGKARDRLVKMVDKASGRTMADREKDAKSATASRKAAEKDHSDFQKKMRMAEKFDFKVSVDGFPEMFMSGNSPGEVKTALRKLVKQPSMIKSVDRVTKAEKKKEFRKKVREEKTSGQVDYGSDESVKILKKKTPGQKDEGLRDFMSGVVNKAKSAMSFMYKNDGPSRKNTNAKSTSGRQNAKASPSLGKQIRFPGYGG